ncbi:MAG: condensation domain-containing protein, partial [Stackebrandtia sp.]
PYDASPPATPTGRGGMCEFAAPPEVLERLRAAARRLGSTLYLLTLSAYALTLSRFTGQDEVVLPTSHANRAEPGYESTVGMIADRIPIRVRTGEASTFADLVGQVGQTVFSALDHQAMPMRLLTASLPPHQRLTPYPGALFTLLERRGRPTLPGLRVDVASEVPVGLARMELYCFTSAGEDGLRGAIEYAADRFDAATIERFVAGFVARLEAVAADPSVGLDAT